MSSGSPRFRRVVAVLGSIGALLLIAAAIVGGAGGQESRPTRQEFTVRARDYRFAPERLTVRQGDIVRIVVRAEDIAHSFVIDEYRIAKRAAQGGSVAFEFRAHRAGTFPYYCNLTLDERCGQMHGELVVSAP